MKSQIFASLLVMIAFFSLNSQATILMENDIGPNMNCIVGEELLFTERNQLYTAPLRLLVEEVGADGTQVDERAVLLDNLNFSLKLNQFFTSGDQGFIKILSQDENADGDTVYQVQMNFEAQAEGQESATRYSTEATCFASI